MCRPINLLGNRGFVKGEALRLPPPTPLGIRAAKLKAMHRKTAQRTVEGSCTTIGKLRDPFSSAECQNDIENVGYGRSA